VTASISGIHHVTCITGDVQANVDFYVSVLGLRFVKKSINQDLPDTYHLYFADYVGSPGTAMTFFGWPTWPAKRTGTGQVTAVSFAVPERSLDYWSKRLESLHQVATRGKRFGADTITLHDPDGIELELIGEADDDGWVKWNDGPVPVENAIRGFHSVTMTVAEASKTFELLTGTMQFFEAARDGNRTRLETGPGGPDAILDIVEAPAAGEGRESIGTVHHVAWRARDDGEQKAWREALIDAGRNVTPVIDRWYFKSIYYREPGGVLFEIATDGPGFTVDEKPEDLGTGLSLPPWFQVRHDQLEKTLTPIVVPTTLVQGRAIN
jgi:glyoxalase family protein